MQVANIRYGGYIASPDRLCAGRLDRTRVEQHRLPCAGRFGGHIYNFSGACITRWLACTHVNCIAVAAPRRPTVGCREEAIEVRFGGTPTRAVGVVSWGSYWRIGYRGGSDAGVRRGGGVWGCVRRLFRGDRADHVDEAHRRRQVARLRRRPRPPQERDAVPPYTPPTHPKNNGLKSEMRCRPAPPLAPSEVAQGFVSRRGRGGGGGVLVGELLKCLGWHCPRPSLRVIALLSAAAHPPPLPASRHVPRHPPRGSRVVLGLPPFLRGGRRRAVGRRGAVDGRHYALVEQRQHTLV